MSVTKNTLWPVNAKGEIVATYGEGNLEIVDTLPLNMIPTDNNGRLRMVGVGNTLKSLKAASKWFGSNINNSTVNEQAVSLFDTANYGSGFKIEAEAPFVAVRLWWVNRAPNTLLDSKSLVGVTETADISTPASAFQPVINGTVANSVVNFPATNGWRAATWDGNTTVDHAASTESQAVVRVSDWIPLTSVPRTDGGERPILLVRNQRSTGKFAVYSNSNIAAMRTPSDANRGRLLTLFSGANMVSTPGAVNGTASTASLEVFPEFKYAVPSLSVVGVGDGVMQCENIGLTGSVTSWGWRACADVSSPDYAVNWLNFGAADKKFEEYWARFEEVVEAGLQPGVLVVQPITINEYGGDMPNIEGYVEQAKYRAHNIYEFAKENDIKHVVFVPLLPYNQLNAVQDDVRLEYNAWLKDFAASVGAYYIDVQALGNGARPERWKTTYNYASNGYSPNELAVETVLTPQLAGIIRRLI